MAAAHVGLGLLWLDFTVFITSVDLPLFDVEILQIRISVHCGTIAARYALNSVRLGLLADQCPAACVLTGLIVYLAEVVLRKRVLQFCS